MQSSQARARGHLPKTEMGKAGVPLVAESLACQVYRTTAMQVHRDLQSAFCSVCPEAFSFKVMVVDMQLLVVVDAEAGRHLLSEALDITS